VRDEVAQASFHGSNRASFVTRLRLLLLAREAAIQASSTARHQCYHIVVNYPLCDTYSTCDVGSQLVFVDQSLQHLRYGFVMIFGFLHRPKWYASSGKRVRTNCKTCLNGSLDRRTSAGNYRKPLSTLFILWIGRDNGRSVGDIAL
jgi:hypothetical protein